MIKKSTAHKTYENQRANIEEACINYQDPQILDPQILTEVTHISFAISSHCSQPNANMHVSDP